MNKEEPKIVPMIHVSQNIDVYKTIYLCSNCNTLFNWGNGCCWYGSIKEQEDDPSSVPNFCSKGCFNEFAKINKLKP